MNKMIGEVVETVVENSAEVAEEAVKSGKGIVTLIMLGTAAAGYVVGKGIEKLAKFGCRKAAEAKQRKFEAVEDEEEEVQEIEE